MVTTNSFLHITNNLFKYRNVFGHTTQLPDYTIQYINQKP